MNRFPMTGVLGVYDPVYRYNQSKDKLQSHGITPLNFRYLAAVLNPTPCRWETLRHIGSGPPALWDGPRPERLNPRLPGESKAAGPEVEQLVA